MTVTYTLSVSEARFWGFPRLLARWRGSIYRLMYREMLAFLFAFYFFAGLYRYVFNEELKRQFEKIAHYCQGFTSVVPITFVLGFYVTFIVGRWWQQYMAIPWPDRLAIQISSYVQGADERGRMIRRAMVRYVNQISVLTFQYTSAVIKARFPTLDHMVEAGIMTPEEKDELVNVETSNGIWWVPAQWFGQLAMIARKEGRIHDDLHLKSLIDEMLQFRGLCGTIWSYDWISVPLVYTQVVTIAVYSFFGACVFGRQYLDVRPNFDISDGPVVHDIDYYVPFFTMFQFFFYVGWLKVAEAMICPFGADDDDFEINWVLDRNLQVGYLIVDRMYRQLPKLTKDVFWNNVEPEIPYTQAAAGYKQSPFYGSTQAMNIPERQAEWNLPEPMQPIDEEGQIGMEPKNSVISNNSVRTRRRGLKHRRQKTEQTDPDEEFNDDLSVMSRSSCSEDDDERSVSSRQVDEKHKKRRLGGLMLGFSRQTLASRFGSKFSINSRSSFKKNNVCRSPPPLPSRQVSAANGRHRLSMRVSTRGSSPTSIEHIDELASADFNNTTRTSGAGSDSMPGLIDNSSASSGLFPPRAPDNFSASVAQIDVPPSVKEEPEPDADTSGSGSDSNTLTKTCGKLVLKESEESRTDEAPAPSASGDDGSVNLTSSRTPLIPPDVGRSD